MGRPSVKAQARALALEELTANIAKCMEAGQQVPCVGSSAWISDHPQLQAEAARKCLECSLIQECGQYASEHRETAGVWGGICRGGPGQCAPRKQATSDAERRGRRGNESRPNRAA